jgi:phospholipid/cholesterol/gamma-HCH transport system substrate-binding protein
MPKTSGREAVVGAFVVIALIVLAVGVMAVGGESKLFARKVSYRASFSSTDGLIEGSPVKMGGVQIGTVLELRLPTDPGATGVEVRLGVERAYASRVRQGSAAALRFLQYLSGEKYVELTPGDPERPPLEEGDLLPVEEGSKILEQGEDIAENLTAITISLREILEPLQRGEGLLGQALKNPEFGKESLTALQGTLKNLEAITGRMRSGEGFAGRLLSDPALASRVDELALSIESLSALLQGLTRGEGAAGDLFQKGGDSEQAIAELKEAASSLRRTAARLESREGLVGKLLNDEEYSNRLAAKLEETVGNLAAITGKINRGEGTLGALVNDRTLYDGAEDVLAGVNDSKFARWMLRHYQKKGIEAPPPPAPSPSPAPSP